MKARIINFLWLWLVIIAISIFMKIEVVIWIFALAAIATQYECYSLLEKAGFQANRFLGTILGLFILLMAYYYPELVINGFHIDDGIIIMFVIMVCLIDSLFTKHSEHRVKRMMTTLLGILYVPYLLHYLILIIPEVDNVHHSKALGFWVIFIIKMSDVGGLLTGKFFGKRKLAAHISPQKTWEGAAGSLLFTAFAGGIIVWILGDLFPENFTVVKACLMAIVITPFAVLGDLVQSVIKRQANVKDSNKLVSGIGGIFDMTDSLILSIPVAYILIKLML